MFLSLYLSFSVFLSLPPSGPGLFDKFGSPVKGQRKEEVCQDSRVYEGALDDHALAPARIRVLNSTNYELKVLLLNSLVG